MEDGGGFGHRGEFWSRAVSCAHWPADRAVRISARPASKQMKTWLSASILERAYGSWPVRPPAGPAPSAGSSAIGVPHYA